MFTISPNYDIAEDKEDKKQIDKEQNNFWACRLGVESRADLTITKGTPIVKTINYYGKFQLEKGF